MAGLTGLEPATSCVTGRHSNQLNYQSFKTGCKDSFAARLCKSLRIISKHCGLNSNINESSNFVPSNLNECSWILKSPLQN